MDSGFIPKSRKQIYAMRINPNYKLREIAGEVIIVNQGQAGVNLTRIISLNASARLLYERLAGKEFTLQDAADVLVDAYHVNAGQALRDATVWADKLVQCGVIDAE